MANSFSSTTRALNGSCGTRMNLWLVLSLCLLAAWFIWFLFASLSVTLAATTTHLKSPSQAVAILPATAMGRVEVGQAAQMRFPGFASIRYGSADATVQHVVYQSQTNDVRITLQLHSESVPEIPIQEGMPAETEIILERITPFQLLLQTLGFQLDATPYPSS